MGNNKALMSVVLASFLILIISPVNAESSENFSFIIDAIGWNNDFYLIAVGEFQRVNKSIEPWQKKKLDDIIKSEDRLPENLSLPEFETVRTKTRLIKYDGKKFEDLSKDANLSEMIISIEWNGEYFLIGGDDGKLVKYDGRSFKDLTSQLGWGFGVQIQNIIPSGELWLIYGASMGSETTLVKKFDGQEFGMAPKGLGWYLIPIRNGSYWFICPSGNEGRGICEYNGMDIKLLTELPPVTGQYSTFRPVTWNGKYLLIEQLYIEGSTKHARLFGFDGANFTGFNFSLEPVTRIAWDGNYWLVNYYSQSGYRFGKLYEDRFVDAGAPVPEKSAYAEGVKWNGKYWLISYRCEGLFKLNGTLFKNLTGGLKATGIECIDTIAWNGKHWLLLGGEKKVLVKYDGKSFTDLTPQIEAVLQPSPVSTPVAPSKPEVLLVNYKNLAFALAAVLLIALTLFFLWRKKSG